MPTHPTRCNFAAAVLLLALPCLGIGWAEAAESPSLSAREIRHEVQCPWPRDVPCAIRKPPISGYRVLTEKVRLDDQGSYWLADLSKARQQQGKNEPIRILTDNGVWHLIAVKYVPPPVLASARKKPGKEGEVAGKKPLTERDKSADKAKDGSPPGAKAPSKVDACVERCRSNS